MAEADPKSTEQRPGVSTSFPKEKPTESKWEEVRLINGYALFMGFLSMGVRGLGFLVLTWTSVVLLGGFVSMLGKKDFWCLTLITLIQTAGIFNVHMNEKFYYLLRSCKGFWDAMGMMDTGKDQHGGTSRIARCVLKYVLAFVQALVFSIILCPLAALYMCGLFISGGLSLWRLIQHDYSKGDEDPSQANMNPALDVLYGLAFVQGVLFSYRLVWRLAASRKASKVVTKKYGFKGDHTSVCSDYLTSTLREFAKDPCLSAGRNLVTYAVKLMESESAADDRSATLILDTLITYAVPVDDTDAVPAGHPENRTPEHGPVSQRQESSSATTSRQEQEPKCDEKSRQEHKRKCDEILVRIEQLIGSPSSSNILHKLLKALGSRSQRDEDIKIRQSSARIVAQLAGNIRLSQFPRGIENISSLFDSSGQDKVGGYYKELVLQGLRILSKLATDQENCRVIYLTNGLISKIMTPVSSDLLHRVDHKTWSSIVDESLEVMRCLLATAPQDTVIELRDEISRNEPTINSMRDIILDCKKCDDRRHILVTKILTELPIENKGNTIKMLAKIFVDHNKGDNIRALAGEKLVPLSFHSQNFDSLQEYVDGFLETLSLEHGSNNGKSNNSDANKCRISAAGILEGLCSQSKDDGFFKRLGNAITVVMPKVLGLIRPLEPTQGVQQVSYSPQSSDVEGQNSGASHGNNGQNVVQQEDKLLQVALLSLLVRAYENLIYRRDRDSAFRKPLSFLSPRELKVMADMALKNSDPEVADVDCLSMLKLIGQMAIKMMSQHELKYLVSELKSLIVTLKDAKEKMFDLDGFVLFSGRDEGQTLANIVEEARKLVETFNGYTTGGATAGPAGAMAPPTFVKIVKEIFMTG